MVVDYERLVKGDGKPADDLEKQVSQAINELSSNSEIKAQLTELYFVGAQQFDSGSTKCIVIYVPVPQLRDYQRIHTRLVRELEKKTWKFARRYYCKTTYTEKTHSWKEPKALGSKTPSFTNTHCSA